MKHCSNCGNKLENNDLFCNNCGKSTVENNTSTKLNTKPKINSKTKLSVLICLVFVILVILSCGVLFRNDLMISYYIHKGNSEDTISTKISYYSKALQINYDTNLVDKINKSIADVDTDEAESILSSLDSVLLKKDLDKLYIIIYIKKAEENFNNNNYETTWLYLDNATIYGYDVEQFEYYNDLVKKSSDNYNTQTHITERIYVYKNGSPVYADESSNYYFIPDSDRRHLTSSELSCYDKDSLGFIRNEIFARHGYIFKTEPYKSYFNSMPWYIPNLYASGSVSSLNSIEKANVNLILKFE
ncbi:YARHG domain-containing protein [Romboutsia weinsteinii]|uniref:YARHG domain-containing protein n=1 Tax=Romboutsia weinsteinii TaxID=2020949 RepID=A0A371J150_9FIRM|nr:YARHG domain-containing protein [Romboutsia weinsteinii]RDY26490.1 YARHG domain-containing protein [Romboutsia weinsteinii]